MLHLKQIIEILELQKALENKNVKFLVCLLDFLSKP